MINIDRRRIGVVVVCDGRKRLSASIKEWGSKFNCDNRCNNFYDEKLMKDFWGEDFINK